MKVLGLDQFESKKFDLMKTDGSPFIGVMGKIPLFFICVVLGYSGNGKTEFVMQWVAELLSLNIKMRCAWISFEQRHSYDLQAATKRNNIRRFNKRFLPVDPLYRPKKRKNKKGEVEQPKETEKSPFEQILDYMRKRNSPEIVVFDSIDYMGISWDEYKMLKEHFEGRKIIIFIGQSTKTGIPRKKITEDVLFDGGMGIFVSKYIAYAMEKHRYGGTGHFVVWEERAKQLNPTFFGIGIPPKRKGRKPKSSATNQGAVGTQTTLEIGANNTINTAEQGGVCAENNDEKGGEST